MFVALDRVSEKRICSLDDVWTARADELRRWTVDGRLVCPGCEQLVRFRRGKRVRAHFAHRVLSECPLSKQSAEILEAKAQLYGWMTGKKRGQVEMDVDMRIDGWDRVADLTLTLAPDRMFAYWLFDRQQRQRHGLLAEAKRRSGRFHFFHTQSAFNRHSRKRLALTASQRDFMWRSDYDTSETNREEGHLCFLSGDSGTVQLFRGLALVHPPNLYGWSIHRSGPLESALIDPLSGEIVFQEDLENRKQWQLEQERKRKEADERKERARAARKKFEEAEKKRVASLRQHADAMRAPGKAALRVAAANKPGPEAELRAYEHLNGPFRCEQCGKMTKEWTTAVPSAGTCLCRECFYRK